MRTFATEAWPLQASQLFLLVQCPWRVIGSKLQPQEQEVSFVPSAALDIINAARVQIIVPKIATKKKRHPKPPRPKRRKEQR